MKRGLVDAIAQELASRDPRAALASTLALLQQTVGARAVAVFDREQRLVAGHGVSQADLDGMRQFGRQEPLPRTRDHWIQPVGDVWVYLAGVLDVERCEDAIRDVSPLLEVVGSAADGPPALPPIVASFIDQTPVDQLDRLKLLSQLRAWEWNVSAVARNRGISRVTVYRLIKRLGIARQKVRRS